jgi:hypothetical protein
MSWRSLCASGVIGGVRYCRLGINGEDDGVTHDDMEGISMVYGLNHDGLLMSAASKEWMI